MLRNWDNILLLGDPCLPLCTLQRLFAVLSVSVCMCVYSSPPTTGFHSVHVSLAILTVVLHALHRGAHTQHIKRTFWLDVPRGPPAKNGSTTTSLFGFGRAGNMWGTCQWSHC